MYTGYFCCSDADKHTFLLTLSQPGGGGGGGTLCPPGTLPQISEERLALGLETFWQFKWTNFQLPPPTLGYNSNVKSLRMFLKNTFRQFSCKSSSELDLFFCYFHEEYPKRSLSWTFGLDIPLDGVLVNIFVSHSFSCFNDLNSIPTRLLCSKNQVGGGGGFATKPRIRFDFVWTHAQCMPTFRVNACAVHAYISCERMRSACLRFVPQTRWAECARWLRVPRIEARAALQLISAAAFLSMWCRSLVIFSFFFFLQFYGRLGELADLQRYGLCEIFESKGSSVMSKMWGSLIASPSSTTSKFPSCRAQALLLIVEISRAEGRYFWFRGFFFWSYASVKKAKLHRGVGEISYARLLWRASWQFGGLGRVRACVLLDFDWKALHRSEERLPLIGKEFCSRKQRKAANSSLK